MRLALAVTLAAAALGAQARAASPVEGMWRTPHNNGQVEIASCGPAICGRIVTSSRIAVDPNLKDVRNRDPALRDRPLKGLEILKGFTGGPQEWKGGTVYNPDDGGTYRGVIKLENGDTLKLTGCIVFPFCRTETWTRIR